MKSGAHGERDIGGMGCNEPAGLTGARSRMAQSAQSPLACLFPQSGRISHGSEQLRLFRRARRDGAALELAAEIAGMSIGEARLTDRADQDNPPPPEAYRLLNEPQARAAASQQENDDMARGSKVREPQEKVDSEAGEGGGIDGEYHRPDAAKAFEIYDKQIKPKIAKMDTIKGDMSQPYQDIKDKAHFPRKVLNFIVALEGEEDAKRDHFLLALSEGLKHRKLFLPRDLVTMANGEDGEELVPTGERASGGLATLGDGPDDDDGDDGANDAGGFDEASAEELAAQEGRGKPRKASVTSIRQPEPVSAATH